MNEDIYTLKRQLLQLRELHASGALSTEQYDQARRPLEQRVLAAVLAQPERVRTSWSLMLGVTVVVLVVALAGYWWTGQPAQIFADPGPRNDPHAETGTSSHPTDAAQMNAMVDRLAARLQASPQDAEGWAMLGRSYIVLSRQSEALKAYARALNLNPKDADLLADYADALATSRGGNLAGEPMQLVERALKAEPHHPKALALAGTHAYKRGDYKAAVRYWQQLADFGKPDDELVRQMEPSLATAREKAGMSSTRPGTAPVPNITGTVTLAPALARQVSPEDTVFIYARDAQSTSRMPLAILRKQVRDLPLRYTLDDSLSMSPEARLSSARSVIVEARVSKSDDARAQPGDLRGTSAAVSPGAKLVHVEIRETVQP